MKGFFGVFNDEIFELKEPTDICLTAHNKGTGIEKIYDRNGREFKVKLDISNVESNLMTNKEFFESVVTRIQEEKIKLIPTLAPRYRVLIDYMLYNNSDNSVIDSGVITKMVEVNNAFLPLGLDSNSNEMVYRVVKVLNGNFDFLYRSDIPFGIMKCPTEKITLYINRVQLQQAKTHVGRFVVGERACREGIVIERCNPNSSTEYKFTDTFVTIFDTVMEKLDITPISTEMLPRKINIEVSLILNNYFYTADPDDVLKYVLENIEADKPVTPTPNPDEDGDDNEDDKDNDHKSDTDKGDNSSDSSGTEEKPSTDGSSDDNKENPTETPDSKKDTSTSTTPSQTPEDGD